MMPESVLKAAQSEITDYRSSGMSVMEMSHRSKLFADIFAETKAKLKKALNVPDSHEILFLQGGATLQFAAIPLNLMGECGSASYAVTGNFSNLAAKEAEKYGKVSIACNSADRDHSYIPAQSELKIGSDAKYFYYCANNTIYGTEWHYVPDTKDIPLVCDMSSDILSKPVNVSDFGLIYAGAQKNMAPAGLTVVIIDKSLAGKELAVCPSVMSYDTLTEAAAGRNRRSGGIAGSGRGLDAPGYMLLGAFPQGCGRIMPDVVKGFHISIIASTQGMCQISKL